MQIKLCWQHNFLLFQVFAGGKAVALAEALAEVAGIGKAGAEGNLGYAEVGGLQQLGSMAQSELLDEVDGGKACLAFNLLEEGRARHAHLGSNGVDVELGVGQVLADDAVQAVNELVAFVGLRRQLGQSLADVYLVAHTVHLEYGTDDEAGNEQGNA